MWCTHLWVYSMTGKESDPCGEDGAEKVRYSSGVHDWEEHPRRFVAVRHAGWQHKAASHCAFYSSIAKGHPCEALVLGVWRRAGHSRGHARPMSYEAVWDMVVSKIRTAALDMRSAQVMICIIGLWISFMQSYGVYI